MRVRTKAENDKRNWAKSPVFDQMIDPPYYMLGNFLLEEIGLGVTTGLPALPRSGVMAVWAGSFGPI